MTAWALRRSEGSVEVLICERKPLVLPRDLGELFIALAPHVDALTRDSDGSFKSSQILVHELGSRLGEIVTRRDLRRAIVRLRRALDRQGHSGRRLVESRRRAGWRLRLRRVEVRR